MCNKIIIKYSALYRQFRENEKRNADEKRSNFKLHAKRYASTSDSQRMEHRML